MPAKKKRDDGEGSAYQLRDGRWRAEVTIGWEIIPGRARKKRVRRYVYGQSEQEAKAARRELLRKRDAGELPIGDAVTVAAWMTYWLDEIAVYRCVPKTMESYRTLTRNWIIPTIGDVRLRALEPEHVERLQKAMRAGREWTITTKTGKTRVIPKKPLSASSRLQAHRVLTRALKVAQQRGKLSRNPAALIDAPSASSIRADEYLAPELARAFLAAVAGRWNAARWSVGLAIGPRQGEVLGLLWDADVDLEGGTVTFQRQLQRLRGEGLVLVPYTKGGKDPRVVALPPQLLTQLRAHRKAQLERRLAIGDEWRQSEQGDLVFTTPYGRAVEPRRDWQEWTDLLKEIGAEHIRQHGGRHTAATLMLVQGVDIRVVQEILGHAPGSAVTRKLYQHVTAELNQQATGAVADALWGKQA